MRIAAVGALLGIAIAISGGTRDILAQEIPTPESVLGFSPGADSLLATWSEINDYLSALATASEVIALDTIGYSTLGRPLLMVTATSATNHQRLPIIQDVQNDLAHPGTIDSRTLEALNDQPAVLLINNNIHSTEIASSLFGLELAHRLATWDDYLPLLDSIIVLMIPSTNPDGLDTVVGWYRDYAGTPYEGGPLPWLYHPYVGHDNNRDWYMITQAETKAVSRVLYEEWFPEVVWDVHQMGSGGARMFLPPFADPVNPNLDPVLVSATNLVGTAMATAIQDSGLTGVTSRERFDLWWHGGFRTVPARHNMIGILSEAASARLASPIEVERAGGGVSTNLPAPWQGGEWRIGDIVRYELIAADGLIKLLARNRDSFVERFVNLGTRAIRAGANEAPSAYLIPPDQRDPVASAALQELLLNGGIELQRALANFEIDGAEYPAGTVIIQLAQPFRAHVKDLFDRQHYPTDQVSGRPYDTAGWTLQLQMGVRVDAISEPVNVATELVHEPAEATGRVSGTGRYVVINNQSVAGSSAIAASLAAGNEARVVATGFRIGTVEFPIGSVALSGPDADSIIVAFAATNPIDAMRTEQVPDGTTISGLPRIGLYRPWTANIDEGWTRWVFEQNGIPYVTVTPTQIRELGTDDIDVLVLPSASAEMLRDGFGEERVPSEYVGGIGQRGADRLLDFVEAGGTIVALGEASRYAISTLNLPVSDLTEQVDTTESSRFLASGSIFGVNIAGHSVLTSGMPPSFSVYFRDGAAFRVGGKAEIIASYDAEPLQSGYLSDPDLVGEAAALVDVPAGDGRVILFGFRPQHRGQTYGTFKALFNAVLLTGRR